MDSTISDDLVALRQNWSKQLRLSLRDTYGGRMPSLSTVSRDLALRSPYLTQVSNETVRKWIRGDSIPSAVAVLALAKWLGEEILFPLSPERDVLPTRRVLDSSPFGDRAGRKDAPHPEQIVASLKRLSPKDQALIFSLAQALESRSDTV